MKLGRLVTLSLGLVVALVLFSRWHPNRVRSGAEMNHRGTEARTGGAENKYPNPQKYPKTQLPEDPSKEKAPNSADPVAEKRGVSAGEWRRQADEAAEPAFARFAQWAERYEKADAIKRHEMEDEGVALARERRSAMAEIIQTNPEHALQLAVSRTEREQFPQSIREHLEEPFSGPADYGVLAAMPALGQRLGVAPVQRFVNLGGQQYKAFVYGRRLEAPSKKNVPLHGIALDGSAAIDPNPVRVLSPEEAAQVALPKEPICGVSGLPLVHDPIIAAIGSETVVLCSAQHLAALNEQQTQEALALDVAESPYTEGRKKVIMFSVGFLNHTPSPTVQGSVASNHLATNTWPAVNTFWKLNSYGHTSLAELGRGSDVLVVTLNTNYEAYNPISGNDQAGPLRNDVRAKATAMGIDLSKYDFDVVYTDSQYPRFSFGGLGYVGAPGAWVVSDSRGITCHEMGHNLGFPHANFWDTGDQSAIGPGANQEYGDPFDVMGSGPVGDGTSGGHYVSKFKWKIGWIPSNDFPRITTSQTVRIYAQDNPDTKNLRGVQFRRDASLDYFLEFRQLYTANQWLMNGIGLRWGSASGSSSQLIDTTPGSADTKNDSAIVIGRTFSDPDAQVHITALGLNNTYPPSIDVRVNFGSFAGNQPPRMQLIASTLQTGVGSPVVLSANAVDPNNDTMSFWWDFGDGIVNTNNSPVVTNIWRAAGQYVVRCVVSDMKGGTASESLLVGVGAPTTYTISGRVLYNGQAVPDVLVKAQGSATRYAYTDSDGAYSLSRLSSGSYTMSALLYPYTFAHPFFNNPVVVGPQNASNIDFARVLAPQNDVTLVSTGSVWKYLDDGSNQGTTWISTSFDDTAWASGPAELGYGDGDERTVIGYGPNASAKYITYYFRRAFNVPDPTKLTNFVLTILRDDGAVVYLNGNEVLRDNVPPGAIYTTPAIARSEEGTSVASVNPAFFAAGMNVLAVEVHQVLPDSTDVSFELSLFATTATNLSGINSFYIASPAENAVFTSPVDVTISANAFSTSDTYALMEFYGDGQKIGEDASAPFAFVWNTPSNGNHRLLAVATLTGGSQLTSAPVNIIISAPTISMTLIASNAVWLYNDENQALGTAWAAPSYSDVTWSNGPAQLGYGDSGLSTTVRAGRATYYFRHYFTVEDAGLITNLTATVLRDDGAIIYLNGTEVSRLSMPSGAYNFNTVASPAAEGTDETMPVVVNLPAFLLQDGTNVIGVEVHQASSGASDARFGLELTGLAAGYPVPGVRITSPSSDATNIAGTPFSIAATAHGENITQVEFYVNSTLIGQDSGVPYSLVWTQAIPGVFNLTAVAYENAGGTYTSAPVRVTVIAPASTRQLISTRALWRYMDDGSDLGASWTGRLYNDSAWSQGYARLGYGNDGETTVVSFGPASAKRHITTYFRHAFALDSTTGINRLRLSLSRDDGAIVYLNGTELHRSNLRSGTVSYNSFALSSINGPDETNFFTVTTGTAGLVSGANVVSVELHQDFLSGNDLGFDLSLIAESNTNLATGIYLTSPAEGARITLPATVQLAAFAVTGDDPVTNAAFMVDGVIVEQDSSLPYSVTWTASGATNHTVTAIAYTSSGEQIASPAVNVVVQGPPIPVSQVFNVYFPFGSTWRYWTNAASPASDWTAPAYDDLTWPQGPARLGFGLDGENTTLPAGRTTYYFRRTFNVANPALIDELIFQLQRDDGAVVYVNGIEVFRGNMPVGTITSGSPAASDATGLDEQQAFITRIAAPGLVAGANIIAVEVHQFSEASGDLGFDLHLSGAGDTAPHIVMSRPGTGAAFVIPALVNLEAAAWPGQGRAISAIRYFTNGLQMAEVTDAPYAFSWYGPAQGNYNVYARLIDNFGDIIDSRPVAISVGYQVVRTNFIAAGAIWKYLDNGTNLGTNWAQTGFADGAWASGPAELGYGDNDEATVVSYGPSSSAKYITTYFRRWFEAPPTWTVTNLSFRLLRDDGAVVWMNGRELYRSNMLTGPITYLTTAAATVDGANERTFFESSFTFTNIPGTNLIAVEIHQSGGGSSDISFNLEVAGTGFINSIVAPGLEVTRLESGDVSVSWPAVYTGWQLYSSARADSGWAPSGFSETVINDQRIITITPSGASEFYQLRKP